MRKYDTPAPPDAVPMTDDIRTNTVSAGQLYVVATPIGNRSDLSPRAQQVLEAVDRICAEDTRTSQQLLSHFGIRRPMVALHEHNESQLSERLIEQLREGQSLALISDAGTPLISDPGFVLVRAARSAGIPVIAVPGPCAAVAALSISGLPSDRFAFEGFLPAKSGPRRQRLQALATDPRTLIFYESSHRIADTAADLAELLPDRQICIARELTKLHEESAVLAAGDLPAWLAENAYRQRGEFVLLLSGCPEHDGEDEAEAERVLRVLLTELSPSSAARVAAELTGLRKKTLYALALRLHEADAAD